MAGNSNAEGVQAIVINMGTFIGVPTKEPCAGNVITLSADGDLTFEFPTGDKKVTGAKAGTSFVAGKGCTGLTSTVAVIIS